MDQVGAETFADAAAIFTEPDNEKKLRLFQRYLTSAERAYNKALKDYRDLQKENRAHDSEQVREEMKRIVAEEAQQAEEITAAWRAKQNPALGEASSTPKDLVSFVPQKPASSSPQQAMDGK